MCGGDEASVQHAANTQCPQLFTVGIGISMVYGTAKGSLGYRMEIPPEFATNPQDTTTAQFSLTTKVGEGKWHRDEATCFRHSLRISLLTYSAY